jgi:diacylglycerol kinase (ATP)
MSVPTCVIFNPAAGKGKAKRLVREARQSFAPNLILKPTRHAGHAVELAREAAEEGIPLIAAAGGDGTVHEVANGVLQASRRESVFTVWPIGSANDYAFTLGLSEWWKKRDGQLIERDVDVGRVTGGGRAEYFVNGLGVGFNGGVTVEARKIKTWQGLPLYAWATVKALRHHFGQPFMKVAFDDLVRERPTLALCVALAQREGNFPLTPFASLDDGLFDIIHVGPLSRWGFIRHMPAMAAGTLSNDPGVWLGQCRAVVIQSRSPIRIHVDGEFFCHPEDGIREVKIELLPKRLRVQAHPPGYWTP